MCLQQATHSYPCAVHVQSMLFTCALYLATSRPLPRVTMMLLFILNSSYYLSLAIPVNSGLCFFLIDVYQTADEVRCHGARSVTI
ncbi:hypothetical protein M432DRAFT_408489 [Thermoascus aurantiacus ATCC 26904]